MMESYQITYYQVTKKEKVTVKANSYNEAKDKFWNKEGFKVKSLCPTNTIRIHSTSELDAKGKVIKTIQEPGETVEDLIEDEELVLPLEVAA